MALRPIFKKLGSTVQNNYMRQFSSTPVAYKRVVIDEELVPERGFENMRVDDPMPEGSIVVKVNADMSHLTGVPDEHITERKVLIKVPTKNSMQSGTGNLHVWKMSFDAQPRWENHLMGWASTADPLSNLDVEFHTKEEAIAFCEKNGWAWEVQNPPEKAPRAKSYAANFSWNKRTRRTAK